MKRVFSMDMVHDYNTEVGYETLHPLVSVVDFSKIKPKQGRGAEALVFGFYAVFLKESKHGNLRYGRNNYDYQEGTLIFIAPQQMISIEEDGYDYQPEGYALLFHPDLISSTSLHAKIKNYNFFSYDVHEALHVSDREKQVVLDCFAQIEHELQRGVDKHSKNVIVSIIEMLLAYCVRFYDRQFITRDNANRGILEKLENLLNAYFQSEQLEIEGSPTVAYCAQQLHLSANYLGDMMKKETGKSAQEYIHQKLIEVAKVRILDPKKSISQIAYELGFKYPQHFSRMFKQRVGSTPNEYRGMN